MVSKEAEKEIILPEKIQKDILKFFLKTSIPRAKQERIKKSLSELSEQEGQEIK